MSERDANQLAADVRAAVLSDTTTTTADVSGALAALDELVALVGTLQQERDEARSDLVYQTRESQSREQRRLAAEAALAEAETWDGRTRAAWDEEVNKRIAAEAALARSESWARLVIEAANRETDETKAALATTRQALAEACGVIEGLAEQQAMEDNWYVEPLARLRALADTGGDTAHNYKLSPIKHIDTGGDTKPLCIESDDCENEWHYWRCPKHPDYTGGDTKEPA